MSHRITLAVRSVPSQSRADVERDEALSMECSFLVDHRDTAEEAGRKAGERIAEMLRQTGHQNDDKEDSE